MQRSPQGRVRTEELAHLVGLSTAGTSKNVATLAAAGLVRRSRDGHYVLYELSPDALPTLYAELDTYLAHG